MDFKFTDEQLALKKAYQDFFREEMAKAPPAIAQGGDSIYDSDEAWEFNRYMSKRLVEKGWLTMAWPKEYGGLDASIMDQMIFSEVQASFGAPGVDVFGVKMFAPTLMLFASDEQRLPCYHLSAAPKLFTARDGVNRMPDPIWLQCRRWLSRTAIFM